MRRTLLRNITTTIADFQIMDRTRRRSTQVAVAVALLALAGCSSEPEPPPPPPTYRIMITEPSGNIDTATEKLIAHWSCDPTVDPATRYQGAQDHLWTDVDGTPGQGVLLAQAICPPGALMTVQVDAAAVSLYSAPTRLR